MNTRRFLLALIGTVSLALASCAEDRSAENTTTLTNSPTSSSSSTSPASSQETTTSESSTTAAPEASTVDTPPPVPAENAAPLSQQVAVPTFVECIYGGGSWTSNALLSDGSYQWAAECQQKLDEQRAQAPYQCPQTDYFVPDPWYCDNQSVPWSVPPPSAQETPAYLLPDSAEEIAGKTWWSDCVAHNTVEYCRSTDPYVNG